MCSVCEYTCTAQDGLVIGCIEVEVVVGRIEVGLVVGCVGVEVVVVGCVEVGLVTG